MPGKSRHGRRKHPNQTKRKKERTSRPTILAQQQIAAQTHEPVSSPNVSTPAASMPTPRAKPAPVQHPYISAELRTIGILAGIILIILVVLALVPLPW